MFSVWKFVAIFHGANIQINYNSDSIIDANCLQENKMERAVENGNAALNNKCMYVPSRQGRSNLTHLHSVPVGFKWIVDELGIEGDVRQCVAVFHATHQFRPEICSCQRTGQHPTNQNVYYVLPGRCNNSKLQEKIFIRNMPDFS